MKARPSHPVIKSLTDKFTFGKYKGYTVQSVIDMEPEYILWCSDEKVSTFSETILNYADEAATDQRLSEAMDVEFMGISMYDFLHGDDD